MRNSTHDTSRCMSWNRLSDMVLKPLMRGRCGLLFTNIHTPTGVTPLFA